VKTGCRQFQKLTPKPPRPSGNLPKLMRRLLARSRRGQPSFGASAPRVKAVLHPAARIVRLVTLNGPRCWRR